MSKRWLAAVALALLALGVGWLRGGRTPQPSRAATRERLPSKGQFGVRSNSSGAFRIGNLSAGAYELRSRSPEDDRAHTTATVDLRDGNVDDLRVVVPGGVAVVLTSDEKHWRDVRFELADARGQRVLASRLWSADP